MGKNHPVPLFVPKKAFTRMPRVFITDSVFTVVAGLRRLFGDLILVPYKLLKQHASTYVQPIGFV